MIWRPYTQHALVEPPLRIVRGNGAWLFAEDGKKIWDGISSWWVNLHGHAHPYMARAIAEQAHKLEQVIFADFSHEPAEKLADELVRRAPQGLNQVFFSDNGSTAVEVALKMAIGYWKNVGRSRTRVLAFEGAYHGDTFGAMAVGDKSAFNLSYQDFLFSVDRIPSPTLDGGQAALGALRDFLEKEGKNTAALIFEPLVLGAGGMQFYSAEVLKQIAQLARAHGVLLIADEVLTGFGRTGTFFACEQAALSPDLMCLSKGITGGFLPLGVTLATQKIFEAFYSEDPTKTFFHGHSYTGSPLACAAANASLDIFRDEDVFALIKKISELHKKFLSEFSVGRQLKEVRQCGTIAALELAVEEPGYLSKLSPQLKKFYLERGFLIRPLGNVIYLLPPYCVTPGELESAYETIHESLRFVKA